MAVLESPSVAGQYAEVDAKNNLFVRAGGVRDFAAVGGGFSVAGSVSAVIAAALAANTMLASLRFNPASSRAAYITRIRVLIAPATFGAAGGVAGTLGWQLFTAQTPTGGTARTPTRKNSTTGSGTDMFDVRDSNAALTGTAPTFGTIVAVSLVPVSVASASPIEWIVDMDDFNGEPLRLGPGDGLALRTQVAMAATQTWLYSYTAHYFEK